MGAILPESWPSAAQAEDMRDGMTLALKTSSLQPAPKLVIKDSGCDAKKAQAAAQGYVAAKVDLVIGATNRPTLVDPALLRPGRFDELIYVPVPDAAGRRRILAIHTGRMPLADDVDLDRIATRTERFTGADLEDLCRRAGLTALRQSLSVAAVHQAHFETALDQTRASVTPEMEREYEQIQATLKQSAMQIDPMGFIAPGMVRARDAG